VDFAAHSSRTRASPVSPSCGHDARFRGRDAMDDSDEEMQLINDVALLDSQLEAAGCPCKEKMYAHLFRNFNDKTLAKKLKLWRFRKELGQNSGRNAFALRTVCIIRRNSSHVTACY
jgi:hypothetical protein